LCGPPCGPPGGAFFCVGVGGTPSSCCFSFFLFLDSPNNKKKPNPFGPPPFSFGPGLLGVWFLWVIHLFCFFFFNPHLKKSFFVWGSFTTQKKTPCFFFRGGFFGSLKKVVGGWVLLFFFEGFPSPPTLLFMCSKTTVGGVLVGQKRLGVEKKKQPKPKNQPPLVVANPIPFFFLPNTMFPSKKRFSALVLGTFFSLFGDPPPQKGG